MKTITKKDFTDNFMEVSRNLTVAELQLLYLFITEPATIKLSQEKIALKLHTHRRTINVGLKKLLEHGYIGDIYSVDHYVWAFDIRKWMFLDENFYLPLIKKRSLPQRITNNHKFIIDTIDEQSFELKVFDLDGMILLGEDSSKKLIQMIKDDNDKLTPSNMKAMTVNIDQLLDLNGIPIDLNQENVFNAIRLKYERIYIIELHRI